MRAFCPNCEEETEQSFITKVEEINIRGELIPVQVEYYHCEECGETYEQPRKDYDPLEVAYREYRSKKNLLQPEAIKEFRKELGITQKEMSLILGIGVATLNRYENGSLQSEAHDQVIRLCMQRKILYKVLENKSDILDQSIRIKVIQNLQLKNHNGNDLLEEAIIRFGDYAPDVKSGYKKFDPNKFFQSIKFFCYQEGVFKTKLMKLLFYADFIHLKNNGVSITGARYAHATHGPVPDQFETWLAALTDWKKEITYTEQNSGNRIGEVYTSRESDLSVFSASELISLASIKEKFKDYNATDIKEYSHREKGYLETSNGEIISYKYAQDLQP